jgi:hypothetical protein
MKNTIKSFQNFLNENKETDSYSNTIEFKTLGDYEIEIEDLYTQLDIINKYLYLFFSHILLLLRLYIIL